MIKSVRNQFIHQRTKASRTNFTHGFYWH